MAELCGSEDQGSDSWRNSYSQIHAPGNSNGFVRALQSYTVFAGGTLHLVFWLCFSSICLPESKKIKFIHLQISILLSQFSHAVYHSGTGHFLMSTRGAGVRF